MQAGERHCRAQRGYLSRPTVDEVGVYRAHVDEAMERFLEGAEERFPAEVLYLVELGLNHEQQHQELMVTDLKHVFSVNPLRPVYREREEGRAPDPGPMGWVDLPGGVHAVGWKGEGFVLDIRGGRDPALAGAPSPWRESIWLTCGEISGLQWKDGGYRRPEALWMIPGRIGGGP